MLFPVIIRTSALFCRLPIGCFPVSQRDGTGLCVAWAWLCAQEELRISFLLYFTYLVVYSIKMTRRITVMIEKLRQHMNLSFLYPEVSYN